MTPEDPQAPQGNDTPPQKDTQPEPKQEDLYTTPTQPTGSTPPQKNKGKKIALIVGAVVLVLLIAAGVAGWLWYQQPQKVVHDAMSHAMQSETGTFGGSIEMQQQDMDDISIGLAGQWQENQLDVTAQTTIDDQDVVARLLNVEEGTYISIENVAEVMTLLEEDDMPEEMQNELVSLIEDKWIAITSDAAEDTTTDYSVMRECVNQAVQGFYQNDAQQDEIVALYKDTPILEPEHVGREDINGTQSYRYEITVNEAQAQQFFEEFENTTFGQALQDCETETTAVNYEDIASDTTTDADTTVEVWVSQWSHEFTQVRMQSTTEDGNTVDIQIAPSFGDDGGDFPAAPTDEETVTLEEVFTTLFFGSAMEEALRGEGTMPQEGTGTDTNDADTSDVDIPEELEAEFDFSEDAVMPEGE